MHRLSQRLDALEAHAPAFGIDLILRRIVRPGQIDAPAARAETCGSSMARIDDESEGAFLNRVRAFGRQNTPPGRVARIVVWPASALTTPDELAAPIAALETNHGNKP